MDQRRDSDEGGGGENNAEQREETAQIVLAQGIEGDPGGLPEGGAEAELTRSRHGMGLSERRGTGVVCSAVPFYMDGEVLARGGRWPPGRAPSGVVTYL